MSSSSSGPARPTIYVCDPSAEATRTESALTHAGYEVVDVPKHRLLERVKLERPAAVVLDVVDEASLGVVAQIRATSGGEAVHVLFIAARGGPLRDAEDALMRDGSGLFLRPVDPSALVRKVEALVGPGDVSRDRHAPRARQPVQHAPDDLPSGRSLEIPSSPTSLVREQPLPELADDIRALLAAADARAAALDLSGAAPPLDGDAEIDLVLGPDDLAGLAPSDDEPANDPDDGRSATSSGTRSGKSDDERLVTQTPLQVAKQRRTTATHGGRSSTSPGQSAGGAPASQFARFSESPARSLRDAALAAAPLPSSAGPSTAPAPASIAFPGPAMMPPASVLVSPSLAPTSRLEGTLPPAAPEPSGDFPAVLTPFAAPPILASLVRNHASGVLTFALDGGSRSVTLRDGDISAVQSTFAEDGLVRLLERRGFLPPDALGSLVLSPIPRLACAALVARGHLAQDDLWPALRLHGEQVLAAMLSSDRGSVTFIEGTVPEDGPSPFGALAGTRVFVRAFCMSPAAPTFAARASRRPFTLSAGPRFSDLEEVLGDGAREEDVTPHLGRVIDDALATRLGSALHSLEALTLLDVLAVVDRIGVETPASAPASELVSLDADAIRSRIRTRRKLVDEGDYFTLLGVPGTANGFEIRQAYLELRRSFEPARILQFAELHAFESDLRTILEVVDEAYHVLRDDERRDRYRRAIGLA